MPNRPLSRAQAQAILDDRPIARTGLTGTAGEYYVAAELSRRGWLATVTIKNAPGTDILAQHRSTGVIVAIQTKTAGYGNQFQLQKKDELPARAPNEWYVLVKLHEDDVRPSFYVVPRNVVAATVYAQHEEWLKRSRPVGRTVKNTTRRTLIAKMLEGYSDRWDLLLKSAYKAPLRLDPWYAQCIEKYGVPPSHPGVRLARRRRATGS